MRGPHNIWRLIRTGATFERTGAMKIALEMLDVPPSVRVAARILGWPFKWLGLKGDASQPPVLRAMSALGPAYIKFGQLLSTRPDLVGPEMADELKVLQDRLPAFTMAEARAEIEHDLGAPVEDLFDDFSQPVAAASIAQVHKARLKSDGRQVAVKILRPNVTHDFNRDIDAFYFIASMVELLSSNSRRLRPMAVIEHFDSVVQGELDLRMEASAAAEFAANTAKDENFHVPAVIWEHSSKTVLTLEWVEGITMSNVPAIREQGTDLIELSHRLLQVFLRHALRDGFFHADMHQGNLKLGPTGTLIALDFGIMGRIDDYTRRVYAEILMGFIRKDYKRVAEVHFEAGYVPADRDVDAFAQALRSVGEPIFGQAADQISMARLLAHLFDVTERFGMETRTELILLQRTMVVVEGVARSLNPNLNIWEAAKPEVEGYIRDHLGPRALARDLGKTAMVLSRFGPRLPLIVENLLMQGIPQDAQPAKPSRWGQAGLVAIGAVGAGVIAWAIAAL